MTTPEYEKNLDVELQMSQQRFLIAWWFSFFPMTREQEYICKEKKAISETLGLSLRSFRTLWRKE